MRTTLTIDDDVLAAVKELAHRQHKSMGEVISSLSRAALTPQVSSGQFRNGIPLLPTRSKSVPVTQDLVNQLREELPG